MVLSKEIDIHDYSSGEHMRQGTALNWGVLLHLLMEGTIHGLYL